MPITDLQRNFTTKQVHLQFNFPIKNVQYWVSEIANIYIYVCVFLGEQCMLHKESHLLKHLIV